jgi:hypothetical protein
MKHHTQYNGTGTKLTNNKDDMNRVKGIEISLSGSATEVAFWVEIKYGMKKAEQTEALQYLTPEEAMILSNSLKMCAVEALCNTK